MISIYELLNLRHIPVNELEDNPRLVSFVRHPILNGIVPCKDVEYIYNDCRLLSCPIVVGRVPMRLTACICRIDKLDIEPIVVGMEPGIYIHIHNYDYLVRINTM
jgi:hypothetical protein